jgi:hypothetical protein
MFMAEQPVSGETAGEYDKLLAALAAARVLCYDIDAAVTRLQLHSDCDSEAFVKDYRRLVRLNDRLSHRLAVIKRLGSRVSGRQVA